MVNPGTYLTQWTTPCIKSSNPEENGSWQCKNRITISGEDYEMVEYRAPIRTQDWKEKRRIKGKVVEEEEKTFFVEETNNSYPLVIEEKGFTFKNRMYVKEAQ